MQTVTIVNANSLLMTLVNANSHYCQCKQPSNDSCRMLIPSLHRPVSNELKLVKASAFNLSQLTLPPQIGHKAARTVLPTRGMCKSSLSSQTRES
mmetsp:Transcript_17724/g.30125  ORF Transcript_17724/g.30125 Transcript_17724/m.30125 type:complete len:95 (-) Transcript_17724:402-686(-)